MRNDFPKLYFQGRQDKQLYRLEKQIGKTVNLATFSMKYFCPFSTFHTKSISKKKLEVLLFWFSHNCLSNLQRNLKEKCEKSN